MLLKTHGKVLFCICLAVLSFSNQVFGSYGKHQQIRLNRFFNQELKYEDRPGPHTLVFFVQGSSDHLAPHSVKSSNHLYDVLKLDVEQIRKFSRQSSDSNIILLYLEKNKSSLWVLSCGKEVSSSRQNSIHAADPDVITSLVRSAERWFPGTDVHLIFRGHSFFPDYNPTLDRKTSFDLAHPKDPYGIEVFAKGLENARLIHPLRTVVFAACRMAYLEVAQALSPFAETMIASQVSVLETSVVGFDFSFLSRIRRNTSTADVKSLIAQTLLSRFLIPPYFDDRMLSHPMSLIDLSKIPEIYKMKTAIQYLLRKYRKEIESFAKIVKVISPDYLMQHSRNRNPEMIHQLVINTREPCEYLNHLDLGLTLKFLEEKTGSKEIAYFRQVLSSSVDTYGESPYSSLTGLNFVLSQVES